MRDERESFVMSKDQFEDYGESLSMCEVRNQAKVCFFFFSLQKVFYSLITTTPILFLDTFTAASKRQTIFFSIPKARSSLSWCRLVSS